MHYEQLHRMRTECSRNSRHRDDCPNGRNTSREVRVRRDPSQTEYAVAVAGRRLRQVSGQVAIGVGGGDDGFEVLQVRQVLGIVASLLGLLLDRIGAVALCVLLVLVLLILLLLVLGCASSSISTFAAAIRLFNSCSNSNSAMEASDDDDEWLDAHL